MKESFSWAIVSWLLASALVRGCWAQPAQSSPQSNRAAETLYLQLRSVGLEKSRVYKARDISFDRGAFHITLDDGTIADRKSTRLNSSHLGISYAVFCLKKIKKPLIPP